MADKLKTTLTNELNRLIGERDLYRVQSLKYKNAAEQVDKQVNRLQHFLSDYDTVDIDIPDSKPAKAHKGQHGGVRVVGIGPAVSEFLTAVYPCFAKIEDVREEARHLGLNHISVSSALARMVMTGKAEKQTIDGRVQYRAVIPSHTLG